MSFNTALSGLRAANTDLQVTGNNIANASTTGFKSSRVEFGDVYAGTVLGSGSNIPGSGVNLQTIRQQFSQGNRNFTESDLDLAINGAGFFVVNQGGDQLYTRAGAFGLNDEGYVVGNSGAFLQGFAADDRGNLAGALSDLRIDVSTQAPRSTTLSAASFNLNANSEVLETIGTSFETDGAAIGFPQQGLKEASTTELTVGAVATPIDFSVNPTSFRLSLANSQPASGNGFVDITLNSPQPATSMQDIAQRINNDIFEAPSPINVQAVVEGGNLFFRDLNAGVPSVIDITNVTGTNAFSNALNAAPGSVAGIAAVTNGYVAQTIEFETPEGGTITFSTEAGASAAQTASELNAVAGVNASARTEGRILAGSLDNSNNNLTINGVTLTSTTLEGLEEEINGLSTSSLAGLTANVNTAGDLELVSQVGADLRFAFSGPAAAGTLEVAGRTGTGTQTINNTSNAAVIGGELAIVLEEGYTVLSTSPEVGNLFAPLSPNSFIPVPINAFDPNDQGTYNHATSSTIFDSLGNSHTLEQFFVRQPFDPADPSTAPNHWVMYVQIDGQNVGDPDPTLPAPQNTEPSMASYNIHFNRDGSLNEALTDEMLVSNWIPRDENGEPTGALGPSNVLQGGQLPIEEPATSSNFEITVDGSTQFGTPFAVEAQDQNGYTAGRLSGLDIASDGIIFARFTNGEAQVLGQVALANFSNVEGLKPSGDTMWVQSSETGEPVIGGPGSSSLGEITAGALEESNVDLSEQLVNLIIAQRNFQASSKTIETANQITQTIINLR